MSFRFNRLSYIYLWLDNLDNITYTAPKKTYNILKVAQSLDGKIATKTGDSQYITNSSSREYVHI